MANEKTLFGEALNIPPGGPRSAFLDRACAGNVGLRQAVVALLVAHEQAGAFLDPPVSVTAAADPRPQPDATERTGTTVGPYKLLERIGRGGMGDVYMAEQSHPVRRRVALKLIKPGLDTRQVIARFEAERQALAMMDHPNIARVFEAGTTDAARPYFVMELVRGTPITDYCDDHQLSPRDRLTLFIPVCHAVQHAHQKGVIHRDLKPSNVLVTLGDDGKPAPKVIDFGIAKATSAQSLTDRTLFTEFRQLVGTPAYMAPEQAEPAASDVDTRSDVYSLGVLLYELLTGTTPLDKHRLARAAHDEVRRIVREEEPPRPSMRLSTLGHTLTTVSAHRQTDPRKLTRLLHGDLDWIVMKAMDKDRVRRYATANDFARDVERFLSDLPVEARRPSTLYRLRKAARRHKPAILTAAAIGVALVLGTVVSTLAAVRARRAQSTAVAARLEITRQRDLARRSEAEARTQANRAEAVSAFLQETLASLNPDTAAGPAVPVRRLLDDAAGKVATGAFGGLPQAEAAVRSTLGRTYASLHEYEQAEAQLRAALDLQRRLHPAQDHPDTARAMRDLARVVARNRRVDSAEALAADALAMAQRLSPGNHSREVADATNVVAEVLSAKGDYAGAARRYRESLTVLRDLLHDHPDVAATLHDLAEAVRRGAGGPDAAAALHVEALDMFRRLLGNDHASVATSLRDLAATRLAQGRPADAEACQKEALSIYRKVLGDGSEPVMRLTLALADTLASQGRAGDAATLLAEHYARYTEDPDHSSTEEATLCQRLVALYRSRADADRVGLWRQRLRAAQRHAVDRAITRAAADVRLRPNDPDALAARGNAYLRAGRFAEADDDFRRAVQLNTADHWVWYGRACLLAYLGDAGAYASHCRAMWQRFGNEAGRPAVRVAKACLLLPDAGIDPAPMARAADLALGSDVQGTNLAWDHMARGIAACRMNDPAAALEHLRRARTRLNNSAARFGTDLYTAIALRQLGQHTEARAAFDAAAAAVAAELPRPGDGDLGESGTDNWLICQAAFREARGLIDSPPQPAPGTAAAPPTPRP